MAGATAPWEQHHPALGIQPGRCKKERLTKQRSQKAQLSGMRLALAGEAGGLTVEGYSWA